MNDYRNPGGVKEAWKVGTELNIDKYIVERSSDARSFNSIGQISATGSGANTITYNLVGATPSAGNNFYRIPRRN